MSHCCVQSEQADLSLVRIQHFPPPLPTTVTETNNKARYFIIMIVKKGSQTKLTFLTKNETTQFTSDFAGSVMSTAKSRASRGSKTWQPASFHSHGGDKLNTGQFCGGTTTLVVISIESIAVCLSGAFEVDSVSLFSAVDITYFSVQHFGIALSVNPSGL